MFRIILFNVLFLVTVLFAQKGERVLPVELQYFYGVFQGDSVCLYWGTATEVNNYGFQVQRTLDTLSNNWEDIGFVFGHGNSNSPKDYSYTDETPPDTDIVYYRLKQIDNTGNFEYSWIVTVSLVSSVSGKNENLPREFIITNFPNPFGTGSKTSVAKTTAEISLPVPERVSVVVYNSLGQIVWKRKNILLPKGKSFFHIDLHDESSGIYFLSLKVGNKRIVHKMIFIK